MIQYVTIMYKVATVDNRLMPLYYYAVPITVVYINDKNVFVRYRDNKEIYIFDRKYIDQKL